MGPRYWLMSIYSVVKDPRRGKRPVETSRGRKSICESCGSVSRKPAYSGEVRLPKYIIQEGKKGFRGLIIVFIKIRAVIGFSKEILWRRKQRDSRYHCRSKVTGEMRVRAESRP